MRGKKNSLLIKRGVDIVLSIIGLIILSPIILIIAILVKVKLGSPILFKQDRVGLNNKSFKMMKFRTMKESKDKNGLLLADEKRLTKFGKILRSLSIDELPELINILKGDMSLIGPRPLLVEYLKLYDKRQIRRHNVLPGLTGWAQVNGRNKLSWSEKFEFDLYYVDNWSLKLDLKIFFMTIYKVFEKDGISQDGQETMEKFNGEN